jgi:hypothetical protein
MFADLKLIFTSIFRFKEISGVTMRNTARCFALEYRSSIGSKKHFYKAEKYYNRDNNLSLYFSS